MKQIEFDRSIYSEAAVREAVKAYAAYAEIQTQTDGSKIYCALHSSYPEERIVEEFSNYVLDLTCQQGSAP